MARRWTQAGGDRGENGSDEFEFSIRSDTPSELRRLIGVSLVAMGAVAVVLGSQAPFMALGFGVVFALFAVQAAIHVPAARRASQHQRGGSR